MITSRAVAHGAGFFWQDGSINYDDQVRYVDLAAAMGYEYVLIDNWWDNNIGRDRMEQFIKYARSKGVEVFLWYSSSGYWNDIEQSPVNRMDNSIARKQEMRWLQSLGVKGIKVDFFGGDKQGDPAFVRGDSERCRRPRSDGYLPRLYLASRLGTDVSQLRRQRGGAGFRESGI